MGSGGSDDDDDAADDDKYHYSCDVTVSDDLDWAPDGTMAHSHSMGWCHSDLDEEVGCTASPGDCWEMCAHAYGDLVAIDWDDDGSCYCQNDCGCMVDVGADDSYLITRSDIALPHECGEGPTPSYAPTTDTYAPTTTSSYSYSSGGDGASCCTYCYACEFANCGGAATLAEVASQGCCGVATATPTVAAIPTVTRRVRRRPRPRVRRRARLCLCP